MNAVSETRMPYEILGPVGIAALVEDFYDRVENEPAYARLRALHGVDMGPVRHGLTRFLSGWLGGPRDWFEGGQCIMSLHRPFQIDRDLADQWGGAMRAAIAAQPMEPHLAEQLADALAHFAQAMVNRPG